MREEEQGKLTLSSNHVWHDICGKYRFETLKLWNFGTHQYISFLRSSPAQELCDLGTLVTLKHLRIQYLWYLGTSGPFQLWHLPYYNTFGTAGLWYLGTLVSWYLDTLVPWDFGTFSIMASAILQHIWYRGTLGPVQVIYLHSFLSQGSTRII